MRFREQSAVFNSEDCGRLDVVFAFSGAIEEIMSEQRRVKYSRPATRNEETGAVCGAWAPQAGNVTDSPSAFVLLGRGDDDDESERAISVREYNFDSDTLLDTVRIPSSSDC